MGCGATGLNKVHNYYAQLQLSQSVTINVEPTYIEAQKYYHAHCAIAEAYWLEQINTQYTATTGLTFHRWNTRGGAKVWCWNRI